MTTNNDCEFKDLYSHGE